MQHDTRYRFRGSTRPEKGTRASVLAPLAVAGENADVVEMRLYDPIDSWGGEWGVSANEFAKALDSLPSTTSEIRLHVNSPGGEVWEALAIKNMLAQHPARVVAIVDGIAASAASFIAVAADETVMAQDSQMMIHDAWGIGIGSAAVMRETGDLLDRISDNIAGIYARKAGQPVDELRAAMIAETWLSADETVSAGLADRVLETEAKVENSFDLGAFRFAGRNEAPDPLLPTVERAPAPDRAKAARDLVEAALLDGAPENTIEPPASDASAARRASLRARQLAEREKAARAR